MANLQLQGLPAFFLVLLLSNLIVKYVKVLNGSYDAPYTNPGAPIHLVTGSAVS